MQIRIIEELLRGCSYPGRGIIAGRSEDGRSAVTAYFIMGRSINSRNRIFVPSGEGIRTQAFDESKMEDPSLIIYAPVRLSGNLTVISNGDQTDTICEGLAGGLTFEQSLRSRRFEPDFPNCTPRISCVVDAAGGKLDFSMSILKSADGNPDSDIRCTFAYSGVPAGEGRFISTYMGDGDPLPSFEGEPVRIRISGDQDGFTRSLWESLNEDNKVSLFTRYISLEDGRYETRIINKNS